MSSIIHSGTSSDERRLALSMLRFERKINEYIFEESYDFVGNKFEQAFDEYFYVPAEWYLNNWKMTVPATILGFLGARYLKNHIGNWLYPIAGGAIISLLTSRRKEGPLKTFFIPVPGENNQVTIKYSKRKKGEPKKRHYSIEALGVIPQKDGESCGFHSMWNLKWMYLSHHEKNQIEKQKILAKRMDEEAFEKFHRYMKHNLILKRIMEMPQVFLNAVNPHNTLKAIVPDVLTLYHSQWIKNNMKFIEAELERKGYTSIVDKWTLGIVFGNLYNNLLLFADISKHIKRLINDINSLSNEVKTNLRNGFVNAHKAFFTLQNLTQVPLDLFNSWYNEVFLNLGLENHFLNLGSKTRDNISYMVTNNISYVERDSHRICEQMATKLGRLPTGDEIKWLMEYHITELSEPDGRNARKLKGNVHVVEGYIDNFAPQFRAGYPQFLIILTGTNPKATYPNQNISFDKNQSIWGKEEISAGGKEIHREVARSHIIAANILLHGNHIDGTPEMQVAESHFEKDLRFSEVLHSLFNRLINYQ